MPRSGSGTYTLPSGNPVVTGTTIETTWANNTMSDIATAMTDSLSRTGQGGMSAAFRAADGTSSVPGISWSSETTTGLYRAGSADTRLVITTTEVQKWLTSGTAITGTLSATGNVLFDGGTFVFNEAGADKDARFEGDTDANLLFTDASTDRVGVGTNVPATKLAVRGATQSKEVALRWERATDGAVAGGLGYFYDSENSVALGAVSNHPVKLIVNDTTAATIDTSGNLGVGTITPTSKLDVYGTTNPRITVSSAAATAPGFTISQTGQTSVAIFQPASSSDLVFFNSAERFRIGSSGQFGIGGANYGTSGQVLTSQGSGSAPAWTTAGDVTLTGTQTLTNKTLTAPVITNATFNDGYTEEVATANTGTSYTINLDNGTIQILTLTGNCTFTFPTATAGKSFVLLLKQDGVGGRTVTWPSVTNPVKWPSGVAPTITSTASRLDKYVFTADGTNWYGSNGGQNYTV